MNTFLVIAFSMLSLPAIAQMNECTMMGFGVPCSTEQPQEESVVRTREAETDADTKDSPECTAYRDRLHGVRKDCEGLRVATTRICERSLADIKKNMDKKLPELLATVQGKQASTNQTCTALNGEVSQYLTAQNDRVKAQCEENFRNSQRDCGMQIDQLSQASPMDLKCSATTAQEINNLWEGIHAEGREIVAAKEKFQKQVKDGGEQIQSLALQGQNCACPSGATECRLKNDDVVIPNPKPEPGPGPQPEVNPTPGTETQNKQAATPGKNNASSALGALTGALPALMGMFNQQQTPTTPPTAQELDPTSCYRPENMANQACDCALRGVCRTLEAAGATQFSSLAPSGGAQLNADPNGTNLSLDPPPLQMPEMPEGSNDGAAPAGGYYAGSGGFNPGSGNFKPDAPPGRARSMLSADILQGVRGGNAPMGGLGSSGPRSRSSFDSGDDNRPGPNNQAAKRPDLRTFMPNGPVVIADRGIAGATGATLRPKELHPAQSNFFVEMKRVYDHLKPTLIQDSP